MRFGNRLQASLHDCSQLSLSLPKKMQFLPGHILEYGYDALGTKRTEISTAAVTGINVPMGTIKPLYSWEVLYSSQRDYCGNVVYGGNGTHVLQLQTPEGYARRDYVGSGDWVYFYTLKDHLGSVRSEFSNSSNWSPGFTHYYPSGIEMTEQGTTMQSLYAQERFNNKELITAHGWNALDMGNRQADLSRLQFSKPDRFSENFPWQSPYAVAANNLMNYIDVNGDSTYLVIHGAGYNNYQLRGQAGDQGDGFKKSAEAYAQSIKNRSGYDDKRDAVIVVGASSTEQFVNATNATYETGKIAELSVFSHGYDGAICLGGQSPGDGVTLDQANAQLIDYNLREINDETMGQINTGNFESNSRTTLWGCNIGGYNTGGASGSFAQSFANYMGGTVRAFTGGGGSEFPSVGGRATYTGRMIRAADRPTQVTNLSTFHRRRR